MVSLRKTSRTSARRIRGQLGPQIRVRGVVLDQEDARKPLKGLAIQIPLRVAHEIQRILGIEGQALADRFLRRHADQLGKFRRQRRWRRRCCRRDDDGGGEGHQQEEEW